MKAAQVIIAIEVIEIDSVDGESINQMHLKKPSQLSLIDRLR